MVNIFLRLKMGNYGCFNTSLAAKGALAHCLQRCTACKIQNGRQGAPKWSIFGHSKQLLINKFFDPSTPSMRKGNSGEREKKPRVEKKD